jgi:hypothetical protein
MSVELGLDPASLLELEGEMFDALEQAAAERWTVADELAALALELAHAHYRAFLAAHSAKSAQIPPPLVVPRPGDEAFKPTPVMSPAAFAAEWGPDA